MTANYDPLSSNLRRSTIVPCSLKVVTFGFDPKDAGSTPAVASIVQGHLKVGYSALIRKIKVQILSMKPYSIITEGR